MTRSAGLGGEAVAGVDPADSQRTARWFFPTLSILVVLGIVFRVMYSVVWEDGTAPVGDPKFFEQTAASLARGDGFSSLFLGRGNPVPTALHPPFFSSVLAVLNLIRLESADAHRIALAFISAGTVIVMGLLGRRLLSPATGLVAATCAAFSPLWVQWGGRLLSESVYLVVIPVLLWVALQCVDRPSWWIFGALGVVIGIAVLTRSEALGFVVLLGVPLVIMGSRDWKRCATYAFALLAGVVLVVGPWVVRNDIQLGGPTISTNGGATWAGAYSSSTFSPANRLYGGFDDDAQFGDTAVLLHWEKPPAHAKAWTELTLFNALGNLGKTFARGHVSDLPGVVLAREGRLWGVYAIGTQLEADSEEGGQVQAFYVAGRFVEWILIPLTLAGGIILGRRSLRRLVVLLAPLAAAAFDAALFFGSTRLRVVAEPSMFLLGSIALVSACRRFLTWINIRTISTQEVHA
jgi:4-amino-4-deoxy-L-arabinose transferase-like glycosyltransferase